MPSHRFTVFPLASMVTNVRSRDALMFCASFSRVKSQETCFHSVAPGARYSGLGTRRREMASCSELAPLGHTVPSFTGLSGSPSIWSSSTLPFAAFVVCASSEQPTAQYGQTECEMVAPSIRRFSLTPAAFVRSKPSGEKPSGPTPAAALNPRNCRRVTSSTAGLPFSGPSASAVAGNPPCGPRLTVPHSAFPILNRWRGERNASTLSELEVAPVTGIVGVAQDVQQPGIHGHHEAGEPAPGGVRSRLPPRLSALGRRDQQPAIALARV